MTEKLRKRVAYLEQKKDGPSSMDLKEFLPCKKRRRSCRLEVKEKEEFLYKKVQQQPLGYFEVLPLELKFHIFQFLTVEELSILTITSKAMRNLIEGYRVLAPGMHKDLMHKIHSCKCIGKEQTIFLHNFQRLGLLMKRSTCLYATRDRLRFVTEYLTKMMCSNRKHCDNSIHCQSLSYFGKFLHTVIAGWDDCECQRVFETLCNHTAVLKNVKLIINSKPGTHPRVEMDIRHFFRRIFVDASNNVQEKAFWLTRILKEWPMVHQARILYTLFGPTLNGEILWYDVCDSVADKTDSVFTELAGALQILHGYQKEWSEDDVISVLDELTSLPDEWLADNVAHLLVHCGDAITSKLLVSKAINGRMMELSSLMVSFCVVCVRNHFSISYVLSMMEKVLGAMENVKDRQRFFNSVLELFRELILDSHEFSDPDEVQDNELYLLVMALTEFTRKMIQMAFKKYLS